MKLFQSTTPAMVFNGSIFHTYILAYWHTVSLTVTVGVIPEYHQALCFKIKYINST